MATPIASRVLKRFIAARIAQDVRSTLEQLGIGTTDLDKLSKMGRNFGVISAYRSNLSKKQNQDRHGDLMADLQKAGYRPQPFKSQWEDMASGVTHKEKSLFVPRIDFGTLIDLGQKYEQDAVLFKDPSGSIGVYFKNNMAIMAFDEEGEMAVTKSTDRGKEYSRGRSVSFGLNLVEDKPFPYHGKPVTRRDIQKALE